MKRLILATCLLAAGLSGVGVGARPALAASLCVGSHPGCFSTLQAAVDAAHDGDVIRIDQGTFAGGITITKSVTLLGVGAEATVVSGGGPVITIAAPAGASAPTVSLKNLTITGGVSHSATHCGPSCGTNYIDATALGGGVEIAAGATVSIENSAVTGNRAAPATTVPSVRAKCPTLPCRFALAGGAGIDDGGALTLTNTTVSDNEASGIASDADGAGILVGTGGSLTLWNSSVTGNHAVAVDPNGRFAEGGGIFAQGGTTLDLKNSEVSGNRADLTSSFPDGVDMNAHGGGIHIGDGGSITIENTAIDANVVTATDPNGQPAAFDAGLCVCGVSPLDLRTSSISGNQAIAAVRSTEDAGPSGGALEFDGPAVVSDSRVVGNTARVTSPSGVAGGIGAVVAFTQAPDTAVIRNSAVTGNTVTASSTAGAATVQGVGITNNGQLDLQHDLIADNAGVANAPNGSAQGGGIWNDVLFFDPPVTLTLEHTVVTRNSLSGALGVDVSGGGLFTSFPVALDHSLIAGNVPDQCSGC